MDSSECYKLFKYYLSLEDEFYQTERFVSIEQSNYKTYSIEYAKLLLSICSEIDIVLKMTCRLLDNSIERSKINEYYKLISQTQKFYNDEEVVFLYTRIRFKPWENWSESSAPKWWTDYNKLKHRRTDLDENGKPNYEKGNLGNVLTALAALYVAELYLFYLNEPATKPDGSGNNESLILNLCKSKKLHLNSWNGCYTFFMARDNSRFNLGLLRNLMISRSDTVAD